MPATILEFFSQKPTHTKPSIPSITPAKQSIYSTETRSQHSLYSVDHPHNNPPIQPTTRIEQTFNSVNNSHTVIHPFTQQLTQQSFNCVNTHTSIHHFSQQHNHIDHSIWSTTHTQHSFHQQFAHNNPCILRTTHTQHSILSVNNSQNHSFIRFYHIYHISAPCEAGHLIMGRRGTFFWARLVAFIHFAL